MNIPALNPETTELEQTYLSEFHASGRNTLSVKNNEKFAATQTVLIGEMGGERSELMPTSGITANATVNLSDTTDFSHSADEPVYVMRWNQFEWHRANSENGTYSLIATTGIDVDNEDNTTWYDDPTGTSAHFYKIRFKNSLTSTVSDFSDPIPGSGYPAGSIGAAIDKHIRRIRDPQYGTFAPEDYLDMATEVNEEMLLQIDRPYGFLRKKVTATSVAGQNYIDLNAVCIDEDGQPDFWKLDYVTITRTTAGVTQTWQINEPLTRENFGKRYDARSWAATDDIQDVSLDEDEMRLYLGPKPRTATVTITIRYYRKFPEFTGLANRVLTPTTLVYRMKFRAEFYHAKAETEKGYAQMAATWEQKYGNEIVKMQRANRRETTPQSFIPKHVNPYPKRYKL